MAHGSHGKCRNIYRRLLGTASICAVLMASGCVKTPTAYHAGNLSNHISEMTQLEPLSPSLTGRDLSLEDARARAMEHNLEYKVTTQKLVNQLQKAKTPNHLPKLYASSYGRWRSNQNASIGVKVDDLGERLPEDFYTAQDRAFNNAEITLSWNLLDLGLGQYARANRTIGTYKSVEQARIGCHQLIVDVDRAYGRMVAFQKAKAKADWLNQRIERALTLSAQHADNNPDEKLAELMFQRELIDINRWYESMYRSLASAQSDMRKLLSLPADTPVKVQADAPLPDFNIDTTDLETLVERAYRHRPEIRRALYGLDKTRNDNRVALLQHLPAIGVFFSGHQESNSFALNQDFLAAGLNLSWDMMRLLDMPRTKRNGKGRLQLKRLENRVVASAIITQIMLARQDVANMDHEVTLAWKAKGIQAEITRRLENDVAEGSNRETYFIKEELMRELSILREDISRADLLAARARLSQSLGEMQHCEA